MRPKKRIILFGDSADDLGRLAYVLSTNGYRVDRRLTRDPKSTGYFDYFDASILLCSGDQKVDKTRARQLQVVAPSRVIALRHEGHTAPLGIDRELPADCKMIELLSILKVISARKRGPRKRVQHQISEISTGVLHSAAPTVGNLP
jgi:hypothetical protein